MDAPSGRVAMAPVSAHRPVRSGLLAASALVAQLVFVAPIRVFPYFTAQVVKHRVGVVEAALLGAVLNALHAAGPLRTAVAGTRPDSHEVRTIVSNQRSSFTSTPGVAATLRYAPFPVGTGVARASTHHPNHAKQPPIRGHAARRFLHCMRPSYAAALARFFHTPRPSFLW